jgi:hypothetical protein
MINNIILTSLFCLGLYKAFDEGMIFFKVGEWMFEALHPVKLSWVLKPLFNCPPCMGSFWGIVGFHACYGLFDWRVIPFIFCVSGLNWLLSSIADR